MSYAMRKASELVGQCAVWKVSKSRNSMQKHGPLHSWRILSTLTIMTYLYRIHIDINCFYIQEATLKDTSRTMSLLIIQTCYNLHVSKPRFQTLEYTNENQLDPDETTLLNGQKLENRSELENRLDIE